MFKLFCFDRVRVVAYNSRTIIFSEFSRSVCTSFLNIHVIFVNIVSSFYYEVQINQVPLCLLSTCFVVTLLGRVFEYPPFSSCSLSRTQYQWFSSVSLTGVLISFFSSNALLFLSFSFLPLSFFSIRLPLLFDSLCLCLTAIFFTT